MFKRLFLLYMCLQSFYALSMEKGIVKTYKIKNDSDACIIADLSKDQWSQYSLSVHYMVDLITGEVPTAYAKQARTLVKQQIKGLKKDNPDAFAKLTHEFFTELAGKKNDILDTLRERKQEFDEWELYKKEQVVKALDDGIVYFDENRRSCQNFWSTDFAAHLFFFNMITMIPILIVAGMLSSDCWY